MAGKIPKLPPLTLILSPTGRGNVCVYTLILSPTGRGNVCVYTLTLSPSGRGQGEGNTP